MAEHMPSIPEKFRLWFPYDKFWKPISPRGPFYPIRLTCKFMLTGLVILSVNHGDYPKVTPVDFSYVVSKHILSQQTSVCYLRLYDVNQNWTGWWCYFEMNQIQNSVDGAVFVITQRCTPLPYDTGIHFVQLIQELLWTSGFPVSCILYTLRCLVQAILN